VLPKWMYPANGKKPLSYHGELTRWKMENEETKLKLVGRGQEFVLDCDDYPEAVDWAKVLISSDVR